MPEAGILVCRESFLTDWEGRRRIFTAGQTTIREGHPLAKSHTQMFEPFAVDYELPEPKKAEAPHRRASQAPPAGRSQAKQD